MNVGDGAVVLDIGGDVGALVVTAPPQLAGAEIEICPAGRRSGVPDEGGTWWVGEWRGDHGYSPAHPTGTPAPAWPHAAVAAHRTPAGVAHAAVFPALRDGRYELWVRPDGPTVLVAEVRGGQVRFVGWPDTTRVGQQDGPLGSVRPTR